MSRITEYAALRIAHRGLIVYRVADPRWGAMWNRIGGQCIGVGVVTGRACWSFVWGRAR